MSAAAEKGRRFARTPLSAPDDEASLGAPMDAREMVALLSKYRWRIVAAMLVPPMIALALVLVLPKSYRAGADIVVKNGREYMAESTGETANLSAPSSTKQESINSEVALLTSRTVAETTIAALGVDQLYPQIAADPPSVGTVLDAAVLQFGHDLSVNPVKLSNVVSLSFDGISPGQARHVLDTFIRVYIDKHTQVFAGRRADGYRNAIDTTMREIRALEQRRSVLKLDAGLYDAVTQRNATIHQRIDAETRLEEAISRQARVKARLIFLTQARAQLPTTIQAGSIEQSDAHTHATEALMDLQQQEAALRDRLGNANPDLQRLRAQISTVDRAAAGLHKERNSSTAPSPLRQQLEQETVMSGAELATTGTDIKRLGAFVAADTAELARLERADLAVSELTLQIDAMTQNLRAMQGRYEQARTDEQTDVARQVSVVQVAAASGSSRPVAPKKLIFGAAGLMSGVLLGGLVALLTLLTSKTAVTGEAAERRIGLPVLAVIPFRGSEDRLAFGRR